MHLQGQVAEGTEFRWIAGSMKIRSRIEQVDPPYRIGWSGRTLGIRAQHTWTFAAVEKGTKVRTEESFEGFVVWLFARQMRKAFGLASAGATRGSTPLHITHWFLPILPTSSCPRG